MALSLPAAGEGPPSTLESALQQSITLFEAGALPAAATAFADLERIFGEEPEYRAGAVQRVVLPMRGYASLAAGAPADAVDAFSRYLEAFGGEQERVHALVLFSLGQALQMEGRRTEAVRRYEEFVVAFPKTPEAGIAHLRIAELQIEMEDVAAALRTLDQLYRSPHAFSLRQEGRLRALRVAAEGENRDLAVRYLLETPWDVGTLPELSVLALTALPLGDYLLGEERFGEAVAAYRLVPSRERLRQRQRERFEMVRESLERHSRRTLANDSVIWAEYYRGVLRRLEAQLEQLAEGADYTGPFFLRYGHAFAGGARHHEAWIVFGELAEDDSFAPSIRQEAHYRWLVAAGELEQWEDALRIASRFVDRYPDAPQAPVVLFLMANAYQELRDYQTAVDLLTRLVDQYPGHVFHGRWRFSRGFNLLLLEDNAAARADFAAYRDLGPEAPLAANAGLWHALSWHFDKNHPSALDELDALIANLAPDHPVRADAWYRRATVLYALRNYDPALAQLDAYLAAFPEHPHRPEAIVLRGDALMGLGRLLEAAGAFRRVGPEAGSLFPYAIFQIGKIYRALEEYEQLALHFTGYVGRTGFEPHPRISEALYWIGWARERQGRLMDAFPVFEEALARFGDDPNATEIMTIFSALHTLHQRIRTEPSVETDPRDVLLTTPDFMDWVGVEQERAIDRKAWTYLSRLRLYEADRLRQARRFERAQSLLLALGDAVPLECLDAEGLGKVGWARLDSGREDATVFFERLLEGFPGSTERAAAYSGLGRLAFDREDYASAANWLRRVGEELPIHPLATESGLLHARTLVKLDQPDAAVPVLEDILRQKSARGRPHAEALLLLAEAAESAGRPDAAVGYYQRVYNLYRAYPDLVGEAYLRSAELFEARGDPRAAWRTYREVLHFEGLSDAGVRRQAREGFERLEPLLPPDPGQEDENEGLAEKSASSNLPGGGNT